MNTSLLDTLVSLGVSHASLSSAHTTADDYAKKAAHLTVCALTTEMGADSPDSVAFLSSIRALSALLTSAHFSARLADKSIGVNHATQQYNTELTGASRPPQNKDAEINTYESSLNAPHLQSLIEQINIACENVRKQQLSNGASPWNDQSCMRYLHAYACARTAYLHAIAVSARLMNPQAKQDAFKAAIRTRLREDLMGEPISPSFFMQAVCSPSMHTAGIALLVLGMLALSLLTIGFINPIIGASVASMGLSHTPLISTAISGCTLGSAVFTSRFFIQKQDKEKNKLSQDAVEQANHAVPEGIRI